MDFGFSDEQEQLRSSVHDFLSRETPVSYARAMMDDETAVTDKTWRQLAELGWLGLTIPEPYGGLGLGTLELAIVMEEMGEVVFAGPFMSTMCLAVPALLAVASEEQQARILAEVASGRRRVTLAIAEQSGSWQGEAVGLVAAATEHGFELEGTKLFVPDARSADTILVAARLAGDQLGIFEIAADQSGVSITPMRTVDRTRKLDVVTLAGVGAGREQLLGGAPIPAAALDSVVDAAKTMLAAEMCGAAAGVLAMSVEYAKIREQFGRPIGSFQAIQHKLADMKVLLENARSLVYYAAWALDTQAEDARLAAAMAKAYASEACTQVAADGIQAHGGIGFTWEHDLHLFFKRVKASEVTYGDATENRELVAELLEL